MTLDDRYAKGKHVPVQPNDYLFNADYSVYGYLCSIDGTLLKSETHPYLGVYHNNTVEVIKEGKTPDNIYEVTIQAEADVDELIQEVDRFQKALKWQKKPRITVVIDNYSLDKSSVTAEQVKNFLIDHLQDDKFPVFDLGEKTQFRGGFVIHLNVEKQTSEIEYQNAWRNHD